MQPQTPHATHTPQLYSLLTACTNKGDVTSASQVPTVAQFTGLKLPHVNPSAIYYMKLFK